MTALEQLARALDSIRLNRPVIHAGAGALGVVEGDETAPAKWRNLERNGRRPLTRAITG